MSLRSTISPKLVLNYCRDPFFFLLLRPYAIPKIPFSAKTNSINLRHQVFSPKLEQRSQIFHQKRDLSSKLNSDLDHHHQIWWRHTSRTSCVRSSSSWSRIAAHARRPPRTCNFRWRFGIQPSTCREQTFVCYYSMLLIFDQRSS